LKSPDASNIGPVSLPQGATIEYPYFSQLSDALIGLDFSIPVEIRVKPSFFLQPEFSFVQKGAKFISTGTIPSSFDGEMGYRAVRTKRYLYNYLDVPVLAKVRFRHKRYMLDISAGPHIGLALSGKFLINDDITYNDGSSGNKEWKQNLSFTEFEYRRLDWGASFGLMLGYEIGKSKLLLDSRYQHGIQNITTRKTVMNRYFPDRYNRGVNISLVYMIPIFDTKS
jgi:hypothetical protein